MFYFFSEADVARSISMPEAITAMREAFSQLAAGRAQNSPRNRVQADSVVLHSMSAAADYLHLVGWKQYTTTRQEARFHVGLYDSQSGAWLALIEANRLGQLRTGAVTGLAVQYLARPDTDEVGLFGSGWQAEGQLLAVASVLRLRRVYVYSRDRGRLESFTRRMSETLSIDVIACDQPRDAAAERPIVITATNSRQPVFDGSDLSPGTLVCAVGSNRLQSAEFDAETARRAELIVCDQVLCCQREAGDLVQAAETGAFNWSDCVDLATVVSGQVNQPDQQAIRLFKSVGMAIEDVALGGLLLKKAGYPGGVHQPG